MSDWIEVELGNIAKIDTGFPFKSKEYTKEGTLRVVRGKNITVGTTRWGSDSRYWDYDKSELEKYIVSEGDIVIGMDGSKVGENRAQIQPTDLPAILAQRVARIRAQKTADQNFLWHVINSNGFERFIKLIQTGTSIPHISLSQISSFNLRLPPLPEQKAIAHILGKLDDKIELNRKMNETLEGMAQALFKSWFVDFDPVLDNALAAGNRIPDALQSKVEKRKAVPDHKKLLHTNPELASKFPDRFTFNETLNKWIPEGWEVKKLKKLVEMDTTSVKPYENPDQMYTHFSIPAFDDSKKPQNELGVEIKSNKYAVKPNATLVSKLNPSTHRVWYVGQDIDEFCICSTEFMHMVPHDKTSSPFWYMLFNSNTFQNEVQSTVTGSTGSRQRAQPKIVHSIHVLVPSEDVFNTTNQIGQKWLDKQHFNLTEIETLTKLRDTLLPQLISGKVRVPEEVVEHFEG